MLHSIIEDTFVVSFIGANIIITLFLIFVSWFIFSKTIFGFQLKVSGYSPKAARYAGFNQTILVFLLLQFVVLLQVLQV